MGTFKVQAGATIETTSPDELRSVLRQHSGELAELARGIKPMRFSASGAVSGAAVTIPAPQSGQLKLGPSPGFIWMVERVSAFGLGTGDTLAVHRTATDGSQFLGLITAAVPWLHIGSKGMLLYGDGESLVLTGSGLTATGTILVNGEGIETPALQLAKAL